MKAEKDRIADDGRRIVDLVVVQVFDAAAIHLGQQARLGEGREHSAVPVRARAQGLIACNRGVFRVSASTAGMLPCWKKNTSPAGKPK